MEGRGRYVSLEVMQMNSQENCTIDTFTQIYSGKSYDMIVCIAIKTSVCVQGYSIASIRQDDSNLLLIFLKFDNDCYLWFYLISLVFKKEAKE